MVGCVERLGQGIDLRGGLGCVENENELDFLGLEIDGELKIAKVAGVGFFVVEGDGGADQFVLQ